MEKVLNFILNEKNISMIFGYAAIITPAIGIFTGWLLGRAKHDYHYFCSWGFVWGLSGPAVLVLWKMYNSITDQLGLDTVKNLVTNLLIFVLIGLILGVLLSRMPRRKKVDCREPVE